MLTNIDPEVNYIHPEMFFSLVELERFNVIKLLGKGKYGKVRNKF